MWKIFVSDSPQLWTANGWEFRPRFLSVSDAMKFLQAMFGSPQILPIGSWQTPRIDEENNILEYHMPGMKPWLKIIRER